MATSVTVPATPERRAELLEAGKSWAEGVGPISTDEQHRRAVEWSLEIEDWIGRCPRAPKEPILYDEKEFLDIRDRRLQLLDAAYALAASVVITANGGDGYCVAPRRAE